MPGLTETLEWHYFGYSCYGIGAAICTLLFFIHLTLTIQHLMNPKKRQMWSRERNCWRNYGIRSVTLFTILVYAVYSWNGLLKAEFPSCAIASKSGASMYHLSKGSLCMFHFRLCNNHS